LTPRPSKSNQLSDGDIEQMCKTGQDPATHSGVSMLTEHVPRCMHVQTHTHTDGQPKSIIPTPTPTGGTQSTENEIKHLNALKQDKLKTATYFMISDIKCSARYSIDKFGQDRTTKDKHIYLIQHDAVTGPCISR